MSFNMFGKDNRQQLILTRVRMPRRRVDWTSRQESPRERGLLIVSIVS